MWNQIPLDLLSYIFNFLSPDSLARATSTCKHWHTCAKTRLLSMTIDNRQQPYWFVAMHQHLHRRNRTCACACYAYNPLLRRWHVISLDFFIDNLVRPVAAAGSLMLFRPAVTCATTTPSTSHELILSNPFTRQFRHLPRFNFPRANPAIGVVVSNHPSSAFQVYVAGGTSEMPSGSASYERTIEMYDSRCDTWQIVGPMPMELAVRLTVWTPNESVCSGGVLYWVTSARAYSVMGFQLGSRTWRDVKVPMADRLECAALFSRKGRLGLFGGTCEGEGCVWELGPKDTWSLVEVVPQEMNRSFLGGDSKWTNTKCVGNDEGLYIYKDLGCGMLVWKEAPLKGKWEWFCVEGCGEGKGIGVPKLPIKGLLLHPTLAPLCRLPT